jgi:methionyl-tRNA synthetase
MNFYITTPIYYVNDSPHLGHAYTTIATDVMARFKRLQGDNVKFLTGTDEHGQKVDKAAKDKNIAAQEFTDEVSQRFQNLVNMKFKTPSKFPTLGDENQNLLNISNDDFIRTTEARHKLACAALWQKLEANGAIYKSKYAGWYSVRDEAYYQESELVNGKAPTGAEVEWVEEESYFFKLSEYGEKLLAYYDSHPRFIHPQSRFNEVVSFVKTGLKDLSISRTTFNWGVPVPNDDKHVMYVWIDALTNYLTACGYPNLETYSMQKFWGADSQITHVVGKDILRFHAVYWPAFLMAAELPLPTKIVAHGWWTVEGEKMSKSLGNVISPYDLVEKYGLDQTRYFLLRSMPFGNDGDLSRERLVETVNAELANNIGNLAQRVLSMIFKNFDGKIPAPDYEYYKNNSPEADAEYTRRLVYIQHRRAIENQFKKYSDSLDNFAYDNAIKEVITLAFAANKFIDDSAPWTLAKQAKEGNQGAADDLARVLYSGAEYVRGIAIMLQPFCPEAADKILTQLGLTEDERSFKTIASEGYTPLKSLTPIPEPKGVFGRLV